MQLRGCGTALVTPFRQDGSIDEPALRNLVAWQVESGIDFLVPCGTTGETPTLSHDEWLRVIDVTIEVVAGRVPILAGATSNSTHDAVEKAKEVATRPGVNAILTASPYYNKPTQEGQYRHFRAIAEAVNKPIILYNVPGRTGANIEPAQISFTAQIEPAIRRDDLAAESRFIGAQEADRDHITAVIVRTKVFGLDNFRNGIHVAPDGAAFE